MQLTVNVKEIIYAGVGTTGPLTIGPNDIKIGGASNPIVDELLVASVANNSSVDIEVSKTGYFPYKMTIDNVYSDNKVIDVVLAQVVPVVGAPYGKVFAYNFSFVDSCSFKADYYSACSLPGNPFWYLNNVLYTTGTKAKFNFNTPLAYQVKLVTRSIITSGANSNFVQIAGSVFKESTNYDDNFETLMGEDLTQNLTISEYRPDLSLAFTSGVDAIATENLTCYTKEETVSVVPSWTLNKPGASAVSHSIVYAITDPEGNTYSPNNASGSPQSTFPLNISYAAATVSFPLSILGTYKVKATIVDSVCGNEFPIEYCIKTCNFVNIKYKSCNVYTIENRSSVKDFNYSIEQHGVVGELTSGKVVAGSSVDITFANPGIFIMTSNYLVTGSSTHCPDSDTEKYIISNHCEIENCITSYITDLLCKGGDPCAPCPEDNELNQILLMSYTYFMKLNKEYALNNFYTGLSESKLNELTSISGILNKMSLFCSRRNCSNSSFSESTSDGGTVNSWISKSGDCGCGSTKNTNTNVNTSSSGCGCS